MIRLALGAGIPLLAFALYLPVGRPDLPGKEFSAVQAETQRPAGQLPDVETLAARLAEHLKKSPGDAQGWRMLGLAYASLDRSTDAAKAFERSVALDGKNAAGLAQYGESLVRVAGGTVTPEAEKIFDRTLAIEPKEPRALFFRGLALEQHDKPKQALAVWVKILRDGNVEAEWAPALRQRAIELAVKLKLDPSKEIPAAASPTLDGPTAPAVNAEQPDAPAKVLSGD
jgi:cytochrome c-type biogenesis protein CcmH